MGYCMRKGDALQVSKTMELCDMSVGTSWTSVNAKSQGHSVTLVESH